MNTYLKIEALIEGKFEDIKCAKLTNMETELLLQLACQYGRHDIVCYFANETNFDIVKERDALLFYTGEHFEIVKFLLQLHPDRSGQTIQCLVQAAKNSAKWLQYFIEEMQVPFIHQHIILLACKVATAADNIASLEYIHKIRTVNLNDNAMIQKAIANRSFKIIDFLLAKGVGKEKFPQDILNLVEFYQKRKIKAANKIGTWWIPFCYDLTRDSGKRMMERSWQRVESLISC